MPVPKRIYRSGGLARIIALAVVAFLLGCMSIGLTARPFSRPVDGVAFFGLVTMFVLVVLRSMSIGIWMTPGDVTARSWLRTWRISSETIRRCDRVPYSGIAYGFSESRFFWMLTLVLEDGSSIAVRSTLAPRKTSARQVDEIARYLQDLAAH